MAISKLCACECLPKEVNQHTGKSVAISLFKLITAAASQIALLLFTKGASYFVCFLRLFIYWEPKGGLRVGDVENLWSVLVHPTSSGIRALILFPVYKQRK